MKYILFEMGGVPWGVELQWVKEVLPARGIDPLPNAPFLVAGLVNVRGQIIPVIRVAELLPASQGGGGPQKILLLSHARSEIGVLVDSVSRIVQADRPVLEPGGDSMPGFLQGRLAIGPGRHARVMDVPGLFEAIAAGWQASPGEVSPGMQSVKEATV